MPSSGCIKSYQLDDQKDKQKPAMKTKNIDFSRRYDHKHIGSQIVLSQDSHWKRFYRNKRL